MRKLLISIFSLVPYTSPFQRWRAIALYGSISVYLVSRLVLLWPDALQQTAGQLGIEQQNVVLAALVLALGAVLALTVARRGDLRSGALLLIVVLLIEGLGFMLGDQWDAPDAWIDVWIAVALAGILLDEQGCAAVAAAALAVLAVGCFHNFNTLTTGEQNDRMALFVVLVLWTVLLAAVTALVARAGQMTMRTVHLKDTSRRLIGIGDEVSQGLFARLDPDALLKRAAESIQTHFDAAYHVQIYLIEPGSQHADLRAATGPVGAQLLGQEYRLDIGGLSVVGRVTLTGKPLLISDTQRDLVYKAHMLLPETRCELAVPLLANNEAVGVIDIQSKQVGAFDQTDVEILKAVAAQLGMAVDGLRLHESAQRNQRENRALYQQTQSSLREIERLNYQITGRAWTDYLRQRSDATALTFDFGTGQVVSDADWTSTLNEAASSHRMINKNVDGQNIVALPIVVRNEVVGAMEFELGPDKELPEESLELIGAVAQRLGLAMENRRLFDETQRVAQREALINDIGADLQSATGVDSILQRAARHLQEVLDAQQVTIRLGFMPEGQRTPR